MELASRAALGLMGSVTALEGLRDAGKSQIHVQRLQEQVAGLGCKAVLK